MSAAAAAVAKKAFSRLPGCIVPKHYSLRLKPDLEKFTFKVKPVLLGHGAMLELLPL